MRRFAWLAILVIVAGVFFRWYELGGKYYGNDEATTSLRVVGDTVGDYGRILDSRVHTAADLLRFQEPGRERGYDGTVHALAVEEPQHPPAYYVAERAWVETFSSSIASRRGLSALLGVAAVPAAYWLGLELFGSAAAALVLTLLVAVSPFQVVYSQQAREYSFFALVVFVTGALLVRALRKATPTAWGLFAVASAGALYVFTGYCFVLVSYLIAVLGSGRARTRNLLFFCGASALAIAAFGPWLWIMLRESHILANNDYLASPLPAKIFALKWAFNLGSVFFDLDYRIVSTGVLLLPIFALVGYAFVAVARAATPTVRWFILGLTAVTALAFLVPDLLVHESRSTASRYLIPTWIGVELAVAYVLGHALESGAAWRRRAALGSTAFLAVCGLVSLAFSSQQRAWWADNVVSLGPIAQIIDRADHPLVVFQAPSAGWDFAPIELTNIVDPRVRFQLFPPGKLGPIAANNGVTFLLDPTPALRASVEHRGQRMVRLYLERGRGSQVIAQLRHEAEADRVRAGYAETGMSLWAISRNAALADRR